MLDGVIEGGWGFVIAVYGITWAVWLGYAGSLLMRARPGQLATADGDAGHNASDRSSAGGGTSTPRR